MKATVVQVSIQPPPSLYPAVDARRGWRDGVRLTGGHAPLSALHANGTKGFGGMGTGALRFRPAGGRGRGMVFSASHLALHMSESPVTAARTPAMRVLSNWASVRFIGCSPVRASVAKIEPLTPKINGTVHTVFTVCADDCHPPNARWARRMPCSASRYCVPLAAKAAAIVSGASIALVNSRMRTIDGVGHGSLNKV